MVERAAGELSVERAAKNEAAFRQANDELEQRRQELGIEGERFPFLCECDRLECTQVILVRPEEYEAARAHPRRFLVIEAHDADARVVSRHDGFVTVEKEG